MCWWISSRTRFDFSEINGNCQISYCCAEAKSGNKRTRWTWILKKNISEMFRTYIIIKDLAEFKIKNLQVSRVFISFIQARSLVKYIQYIYTERERWTELFKRSWWNSSYTLSYTNGYKSEKCQKAELDVQS